MAINYQAQINDLKEEVEMHDVLLRGDGKYAGAIADLRAVATIVQEMQAVEKSRREEAINRAKEVRGMRFQIGLVALGLLVSLILAWFQGHTGHK